MNPATYAILNIGIATFLAGLSLPLIFRKIPMNHVYGIRFPQSFKSDEAWYEINAYGGKALLFSTLPILLYGIYGLVQRPEIYPWVGTAVLVISVITACFISYLKARAIDKK